jgi:SAM-dependent methyltransferase
MPESPLDYLKAYALGFMIEKEPITAFIEVSKIIAGFIRCKRQEIKLFIPIKDSNSCNRILIDNDRKLYLPVVFQMCNYAPQMMSRKIPEANVQQAFVLNMVYNLAMQIDNPRILCVGSFEDTAAASLKAIGYQIEEIDPSINYDLDSYCKLVTTKKDSYDIIFSTSVLEHVDDDKLFIEETAGLLKPGGAAILTCDFNNRYRAGDKLPSTDFRFYTDVSLKELMKSAMDCSLVGEPIWNEGYPDFVYEKVSYCFASLVFRKDIG